MCNSDAAVQFECCKVERRVGNQRENVNAIERSEISDDPR